MRTLPTLLLVAGLALPLASCGGYVPEPSSMSAARAGLRPEYRLFYDSLEEHGDWILIEPYGYVFRPRVSAVAWRPYDDGFWAPSDVYGWVWISAEPFGWATFHYGRWMFDRFQGWVWLPGLDWAPAWVNWADAGDYVGWSPLLASGSAAGDIPGGAFRYAPVARLGETDLKAYARPAAQQPLRETPVPIDNPGQVAGVTYNRGPSIARVERAAGPLTRVSIEDAVPALDDTVRRLPAAPPGSGPPHPLADQTDRAAREAAQRARVLVGVSSRSPAQVRMVRPIGGVAPPPEKPERPHPRPVRAPADSTRR